MVYYYFFFGMVIYLTPANHRLVEEVANGKVTIKKERKRGKDLVDRSTVQRRTCCIVIIYRKKSVVSLTDSFTTH